MKIIIITALSVLTLWVHPVTAFAPQRIVAPSGVSLRAETLPIMADESVMSTKAHGSSDAPVQKDLRWGCDFETADRICNFNRHYAEFAGYLVFAMIFIG